MKTPDKENQVQDKDIANMDIKKFKAEFWVMVAVNTAVSFYILKLICDAIFGV